MDQDDLILNQSEQAVSWLLEKHGSVHFVTDNTGTEAAADLLLADFLIQRLNTEVVFHVKMAPTYVSDATAKDITFLIQRMKENEHNPIAELGKRLEKALITKYLKIVPHPFWNSCFFLHRLNSNQLKYFREAKLVIFKGDMNYRRMMNDTILPPTTPFSEVVSYFPTSILVLRTMKSDPIVGLEETIIEELDEADPQWRVNGKRGIIQFNRNVTQ